MMDKEGKVNRRGVLCMCGWRGGVDGERRGIGTKRLTFMKTITCRTQNRRHECECSNGHVNKIVYRLMSKHSNSHIDTCTFEQSLLKYI